MAALQPVDRARQRPRQVLQAPRRAGIIK